MARAGSAVHAMRIIALPLTRPGRHSTKQVLTYYQFQVHHSDKSGARDRKKTPSTVGRYANLAQQKALDIWDRFGNADEGNWKVSFLRLDLTRVSQCCSTHTGTFHMSSFPYVFRIHHEILASLPT
ncbi:hypothetical protein PLICRDRAFT_39365 [Plicaturopsis crispa FD-325 SS-3]|nr:hypothetical protein PLICRDRAFT_39365 [Plicaturopsis crispa FD-325 SS-3]